MAFYWHNVNDSEAPYTRIPNAILDTMGSLGNAELRVLLAIARRTVGWQKECDVISLTQLEDITGLGRRHVIQALQDLEQRNYIEHTPAKRNGRCYRLVTLGNQSPKVTSNLREPELVTLGNQSEPQLVTLGNTQKKELKEKKEKRESTRAPASLDFMHEGVATYKRLSGRKVAPAMAALIASTVTDVPWFEKCVTAWVQAGFNPGNVKGMIDWYNDPRIMERRNGALQRKQNNGRHPDPRAEWAGFTETDLDKPL